MLLRSATFDSHQAAACGRSWIPLGNWRHVVSDEQFLTSPFLPVRFHLFSHQLKFFFERALRAPLGPRAPGHLPRLPPSLGGPGCIVTFFGVSWLFTLLRPINTPRIPNFMPVFVRITRRMQRLDVGQIYTNYSKFWRLWSTLLYL